MTNTTNRDGNSNNCQFNEQGEALQERLSAFVDGELEVDEFEEIRQHIALCKNCSRIVERFRMVDSRLFTELSRPHALRPSPLPSTIVNKQPVDQPVRELVLSNASPSRHWLATGTLAAAGVAVLAAFATGTFSSSGDSGSSAQQRETDPFSPVFMTNVVAPLGEMALSNEVYESQQRQVARSLDLELRLLRLDTKNMSNDDASIQEINDEIEKLMEQVENLGYAVESSGTDLPAM